MQQKNSRYGYKHDGRERCFAIEGFYFFSTLLLNMEDLSYPTLQQHLDHRSKIYSNQEIVNLVKGGDAFTLNLIINGPYYGINGLIYGWYSDEYKVILEQGAKYNFIVEKCKEYKPVLLHHIHRNRVNGGSKPSSKTKTSARHLVNGKSYVIWQGPKGGLYFKRDGKFVRIK